ncbi:MAG: GNAT family N-acetyltransferase [Henriciella sp.]|uniref:GNAT family N-acetyltransferase n=1 Tax=Henriciella sp. TaxID=1968823 RepID=UPI0026312715|nr:GNAT family N-acetyltransferase [Henriciella sp.]
MTHQIHIRTPNGSPVMIRPLEPRDEPALREAIGKFSNRSRYLRFFSNLDPVPEPIIHRLSDVDGVCHLAWVAINEDAPGRPVIGAVHAMRGDADTPSAEFAIGLLDDWHGQGLARLLIAILAADVRGHDMTEMSADVLWENRKGRALMKSIGALSSGSDATVVEYRMDIETVLSTLRETMRGPAMQAVFDAIDTGSLVPAAA